MLYVNICGPHSNLYICQYCDSCKLIHLVLEQFIARNYLAACSGSVHNSVYYINLNLAIKTAEGHPSYVLNENKFKKKKTNTHKKTFPNVFQIQNFHNRSTIHIYS